MWFLKKTPDELNILAEKQFHTHEYYEDIVQALQYTKMEWWKIIFNERYNWMWDSFPDHKYLFKWKEYLLFKDIFIEQNKILIPQIIKWFKTLWYKVLWMKRYWISVVNKNWNKEEFNEVETRSLLNNIKIPLNSFEYIYTKEFEKYL